jgi:Domain of unknown function (DUF4397)
MRIFNARALGLCATSIALALAAPAVAATAAPASRAPGNVAYVRGAHLSPDTPGVDVYLTAFRGGTQALWLSDVGYGDVSPYRQVKSGTYAVSMRPHGAASSTKPALTWTINLDSGRAYTAAAIGMNAQLHGTIFDDTLNKPGAGTGLVRVVQASSRAGTVRVSAGSKTLTGHCAFGCTTAYQTVPRGSWTVSAKSLTDPSLAGKAPVTIASQSITSVILLDTKTGGVEVHPLLDAAGASSAPRGAVPAGGGGTAQHVVDRSEALSPLELSGAFGLLLATAGGWLLLQRRKATGKAPVAS